jgi:hypothetical protein
MEIRVFWDETHILSMGEIVSELWTFHAALIFKDNRSLWIDLP